MSRPRPSIPPEVKPPPAGTRLCALNDLKAIDGKGFSFGQGRFAFSMFVVRRNDKVYGYLNDCPHTRGPLEFTPDQFLDVEKTHILCSRHGAVFRFEDGLCISTPCPGAYLTPVAVEIIAGDVVIAQTP
jgi:nitrite reductase/ring-hydroxylating ferredoxin subunit